MKTNTKKLESNIIIKGGKSFAEIINKNCGDRKMQDDGFLIDNMARKFDIIHSDSWQDDYCIIRPFHTGDTMNYVQVFSGFNFEWMKKIDAKVIVDLGAYVGYTSFMFRKWFPNAYILAVEPNEINFRQLRRHAAIWHNTQKFEIMNKAVWPVNDDSIRYTITDHGTNSRCMNELDVNSFSGQEIKTKPIKTVTMANIFKFYKWINEVKIDILKIDIEGSEQYLFDKKYDLSWLDNVNNICIELHGQKCKDVFFNAMMPYNYQKIEDGEHTILLGIKKK